MPTDDVFSWKHSRRLRSGVEDGPAVGVKKRVRHGVHVLQEELSLSREELRSRPGRTPARTGVWPFRGKAGRQLFVKDVLYIRRLAKIGLGKDS